MRLLGYFAIYLALLSAAPSSGLLHPRCGSIGADTAMVSSMEGEIAQQCDCCGPPLTNAPCVLGMVKSALRSGTLSRPCARKVLRDAIRACPLAGTDSPCRVCNADADCAAGEFCECRMGNCDKTSGVCVARPEVCAQIAAPVCGCDGMTYANDCERQAAGACKRKDGPCLEVGGCVDPATGKCTGEACSPHTPCTDAAAMCSPACGTKPPQGTCFDLLTRSCTDHACDDSTPCLPKQTCLRVCPPPTPAGKCFVTVDGQCTDQLCGPDKPCTQPNEFCNPACVGPPSCTSDGDCNDGNGCTADRCVNGDCEHECVCVGPSDVACCPGPAAMCGTLCGADSQGSCGGSCPEGSHCTASTAANAGCGCVSPLGGPCGGNILAPPPVCEPGLICEHANPDATGICVEPCGMAGICDGACTTLCPDGTKAAGTCVAGADATLPCTCKADCTPAPTPTAGACDDVAACGGSCPTACADGSIGSGHCALVVVDPPGRLGLHPMQIGCKCLSDDCPTPPTPTPGPCGANDACEGPCATTCPDGTAVTGKCFPAPVAGDGTIMGRGLCACIADCGPPPPTPTPGGCGSNAACEGSCTRTCDDGTTATGQCIAAPALSTYPSTVPAARSAYDKRGLCVCSAQCEPPPGRCFDPASNSCTDQACDATHPCAVANQICTPKCPAPQCSTVPCGGRCVISPPCPVGGPCAEFPSLLGQCVSDAAGNCGCVPASPRPTGTPAPSPTPQCNAAMCGGPCIISFPFPCPQGKVCEGPDSPVLQGQCAITANGSCDCVPIRPTPPATPTPQCTGAPCGGKCVIAFSCPPGMVCPELASVVRPGQCTADAAGSCRCVPVEPPTPKPECATDADCNDDNSCTADRCVNGTCRHGCICLSSNGEKTCCPGPSGSCAAPCASDATGMCGGSCPVGASCQSSSASGSCQCVSGPGGPCGGFTATQPPVCAPGLVCHQSLPDVVGYCEKPDCVPLFTSGCSQTADCCEPCENGTHAPCGVCINGTCEGAP